jgi:hypothetical protein
VQTPPHCCIYEDTFLWDLAAVYPPGAKWESLPPRAQFLDGTMLRAAPQLDSLIPNP